MSRIILNGRSVRSLTPAIEATAIDTALPAPAAVINSLDAVENRVLQARHEGYLWCEIPTKLGMDAAEMARIKKRLQRKGRIGFELETRGSSTRLAYRERIGGARNAWTLEILSETFLEVMSSEKNYIKTHSDVPAGAFLRPSSGS